MEHNKHNIRQVINLQDFIKHIATIITWSIGGEKTSAGIKLSSGITYFVVSVAFSETKQGALENRQQ